VDLAEIQIEQSSTPEIGEILVVETQTEPRYLITELLQHRGIKDKVHFFNDG
jgi:CheY-like chemotaxis protein